MLNLQGRRGKRVGGGGGTQGVKPAGVRGVNGEEAKYLGLGIDCSQPVVAGHQVETKGKIAFC